MTQRDEAIERSAKELENARGAVSEAASSARPSLERLMTTRGTEEYRDDVRDILEALSSWTNASNNFIAACTNAAPDV